MNLVLDYDRLAIEYARHRQVHPGVLAALCVAAGPGTRALEVGCGTGNYVTALQAHTGCPAWGIDPSAEMLAHAHGRGSRVVFGPGAAEDLPFERDTFDLLFSVDVIHHVRDRAVYYEQAYRVLTAGGWICTATDSEWIIRHRRPLATYFPETVEVELGRYEPVPGLQTAMARAGFEQISTPMVECAYDLTDIRPYREKAFSVLHLIPDAAFRRGIEQMEQDLARGPIPCVSRYTLLWGHKGQTA